MKKTLLILLIEIIIHFCFPKFLNGQYTKIDEISVFGTRLNAPVVMDVQKSADRVVFNAINKSYFPYDFTLKFSDFQNMSPRVFEHKTLLQPGVNKIFALDIVDKTKAVSYQYTFIYSMVISKNPELSFPYLIPVGAGKKVMLDTIRNDTKLMIYINHFKFGASDTVFSVRKGIVTALPDNNVEVERISKLSSLEILHNDGTIAIYLGVNPPQCFLHLGQTVYPGQPVGIIGDGKILILYLLAMKESSKLNSLDIYYSGQNGENISAKLINGIKVFYPENIIEKEMTSREIKKYEKGDLF